MQGFLAHWKRFSNLVGNPRQKTRFATATCSFSILSTSHKLNVYRSRYPADPLDRIWEPFNNPSSWTQVNTTSPVRTPPNDMFQAPSMVMQSGSSNHPGYQIRFYWVIELEYKSPTYFVVMYFAELVPPPSPNPGPDPKKPPKKGSGNSTNQLREFSISINGYTWYDLPIVPQYLMTSEVYGYTQPTSYTQYNVLLQPTDNATLAPILNAVEIFVVLPTADLPTDSGDCRFLFFLPQLQIYLIFYLSFFIYIFYSFLKKLDQY